MRHNRSVSFAAHTYPLRIEKVNARNSGPWSQPGGIGTPILANDPTGSVEAGGASATGVQSFAIGLNNTASGASSCCVGGEYNQATNTTSSCFSGSTNLASGGGASCIGGFENIASGSSAATVACFFCQATGTTSIAIASNQSIASGYFSAVIGSASCTSSGKASVCLGGENCISSGANSVALGVWSSAIRDSQVSHASLAINGPVGTSQQWWLEFYGTTPGSATGESVNLAFGSTALTLLNLEPNKSYTLETAVVASGIIGGVRNQASFKFQTLVDCNGAGIATIVGTASIVPIIHTAGAASWTFAITTDGASSLLFTFTTGSTQAQTAVTAALSVAEVLFA